MSEFKDVSFEKYDINQTTSALQTNIVSGLDSNEALERLEKYGKNELVEKQKKSWFMIFLGQLNNPMIFVLFAAIAVTIGVSIYETVNSIKSGNGFDFVSTGLA